MGDMMSEPANPSDRARRRLTPENVPPTLRESYERRRAERRTPEYQAALARDIEAIRKEFPPKGAARAEPDLVRAFASLHAERERLGLTLEAMQERTGIDAVTLSRLECGAIPDPTLGTLLRIRERPG